MPKDTDCNSGSSRNRLPLQEDLHQRESKESPETSQIKGLRYLKFECTKTRSSSCSGVKIFLLEEAVSTLVSFTARR
jgi:hypothetical protein